MRKVKQVKVNLVGQSVPKEYNGNVGRYIERKFDQTGFDVNYGYGVDLPEIDTEIKSRKVGSTAPHTIATMSAKLIIKTPYAKSIVKAKFSQQLRIGFDDDENVVTTQQITDFTDPDIQSKIEEAYENARKVFIAGLHGSYVYGNGWGYFEHKAGNSYSFRIPHSKMQKLLILSQNSAPFQNLFDSN